MVSNAFRHSVNLLPDFTFVTSFSRERAPRFGRDFAPVPVTASTVSQGEGLGG